MTERVRETGTVSDDAGTRAWMALPRRIYLDTSTLQSNDQNLWMALGPVT
jgi:hypothetical protein